MRCLIVDDEYNAHLVLKNYIAQTEGLVLEGQCFNVFETLQKLQESKIDVIFLDMQLPDASGFSILRKQQDLCVILTTAYQEFALESYDYGVVDYLLKPFSYNRFLKAINKIPLSQMTDQKDQQKKVSFKVDDRMEEFAIDDIVYIQSWGNFIKLFTLERCVICSSTTSKALLELPRQFFLRIHKSYIVNLDFVEAVQLDYVILKTQTYLPIGITYRRVLSDTITR